MTPKAERKLKRRLDADAKAHEARFWRKKTDLRTHNRPINEQAALIVKPTRS